ncbi:hypothetical protein [Riemerella anatipestifer]|uniref:hypothetical protein n=1 Tax=Riemerella anatipestifer TaxID=34085 RepID=UPI001BDA6129|nr:hypothetical protein [Riemerella anatipestifer]MBT0551592.1 hypothetical protein [Riemerella anatipestifer]MBT0552723.1 hypothetical protein [Riemerella anatipestifer]MCE3023461.1 hypothetical protein [Riemerella anatipestifer]MCU7558954.1 hypothetical protein [Riemerella anatipestifer]MDY3448125.1 hypothetical protein [Riemerella anatipestifer]
MEGITLQRSKEQHRKALEVLEEAKKLNKPVVFLKRGQSLEQKPKRRNKPLKNKNYGKTNQTNQTMG